MTYELVISEANNKLKGYSLTVFTINDIENTGIKSMKIKPKKGKIAIEDDDLIFNDYAKRPKRVVLYSTLHLEEEDDSTFVLQGSFFTRSIDRSTFTGTIRLEKNKNFSEARMVPQLKKMDLWNELSIPENESDEKASLAAAVEKNNQILAPASTTLKADKTVAADKSVSNSEVNNISEQKTKIQPEVAPDTTVLKADMTVTNPKSVNKSDVANLPEQKKKIESAGALPGGVAKIGILAPTVAEDIASRKTEVIRSIYIQSDSLVLSLYDNGEIDGDTVSVVVNDKIVIARQLLGIKAINATVHMPPGSGDSLRLIMYAENLGRIPPNTGLLIVQDGDEQYQIRFSGDYQKNSAIILRRKR